MTEIKLNRLIIQVILEINWLVRLEDLLLDLMFVNLHNLENQSQSIT